MSRAAKIILALAAALLLLGVAAGVTFWKRPLATLAWLGRRRLTSTGFEKRFQPSAAGPQCVFSGGGGAPVVLVHGAGDQAGGWAKVAPRLAKTFTVVAVDLAGHGESAPVAGPLPFATLLAGFDGAMKELPQGKVTLVGNSLGAWVATVWAKEHPERVQHLVLVNGGPLLGDRPDLTLQPKNRAEADRTLQALRDSSSPIVPDFVVDDIIRVAATGPIARLAAEPKNLSAYLLDGKLGAFDVPVDLLWGASDKLLSLDYAKRLAAQLPAARLTAIERCGHAPQVECSERFAEALMKVLKDPLPAPTVSAPPVAAPASAATAKP
jgi:pimeloyl-ACP methyl ester carboxylesterase